MHNSQEVALLIKSISKSKKITIGKMLSDCELSKNTLSSMQSGGYLPRAETLVKIADYLDCSVDYLLGRTDNPDINKWIVINYVYWLSIHNHKILISNILHKKKVWYYV